MKAREFAEREWTKRALRADREIRAEDERVQVRLAELDAMESKLRRIAGFREEIGLTDAGKSNAFTPPCNRNGVGGT